MKHTDFSSYQVLDERGGVFEGIAIGWINESLNFKKGSVPEGFLDRLFELCKHSRVEVCRSMTPCPICYPTMAALREATFSEEGADIVAVHSDGREIALGGASIVVPFEGKVYVSPDLIWHYICEHKYLPPDEYIHAVNNVEVSR